MTMPTHQHEAAIDAACEFDGFVRHSFMLFVKSALVNSQLESPAVDLLDLYQTLRAADNAVKNAVRGAVVRKLKESYIPDGIFFEVLDDIMPMNASVHDFFSAIDRVAVVVPDAWRYIDGRIEVLEVVDTSRVSWKALCAISFVADLLFYSADLDVELLEYDVTTKRAMVHNLVWPFDMEYDGAWKAWDQSKLQFWHEKTQRQKLRHYFDEACFKDVSGFGIQSLGIA